MTRGSRPLGLGMIALALILPGCGPPQTDGSARLSAPRIAPASPTAPATRAAPIVAAPNSSASRGIDRATTAAADWVAAAREDPDPTVRLHALGVWAQRPTESLDPVTYALVDPDEAVRARAQELLEQELARR